MILPFKKIMERVEIAKEDSDLSYFTNLLYAGEMLIKIVILGLISLIDDNKDRHKYKHTYRIVRSDSLGNWVEVMEDILSGTSAQCFITSAYDEQNELTQKITEEYWQYCCIDLINQCNYLFDSSDNCITKTKVQLKDWFPCFVKLRNRTKGHGATPHHLYAELSIKLEKSILLFVQNFNLFKREWAFLYRNLSGKYRVTKWSENSESFDYLKFSKDISLKSGNGVYVFAEEILPVELIYSDAESLDIFLPNGNFKNAKFETISYYTDNIKECDGRRYLGAPSNIPRSDTHGLGKLDAINCLFSNLPPEPKNYINRASLERELMFLLNDDHHPIITLVGKGGIGKTYLALRVLYEITKLNRYGAIIWFSSRDIDLHESGRKIVKPQVVNIDEIAKEFTSLIEPKESVEKGFKDKDFLGYSLTKSTLNEPLLFVFDNFETCKNPVDLFCWLDSHIRSPNKILITTRHREFRGDYPVEVKGMSKSECELLIHDHANRIGIKESIDKELEDLLFSESEGHPYVIKILLGELNRNKTTRSIERILSSQEDILEALFERTFISLSPLAKRVYLLLSSWRTVIPQIALESVMLNRLKERIDVQSAIDELSCLSLIDVSYSEEDFALLSVPLISSIYGKQRLSVEPSKISIESDKKLLVDIIGVSTRENLSKKFDSKILSIFRNAASKIADDPEKFTDYIEILEYICGKFKQAWVYLADFYEETYSKEGTINAIKTLRKALQKEEDENIRFCIWGKIAILSRKISDSQSELHALVECSVISLCPFYELSNNVNRINSILRFEESSIINEEKQVLLSDLANCMYSKIESGNADDCSRLAWLYLHLKNEDRAREIATLGLSKDSMNNHCYKIAIKLSQDELKA